MCANKSQNDLSIRVYLRSSVAHSFPLSLLLHSIFSGRRAQVFTAAATRRAPFRVERAAAGAAYIHCFGEPVCDDRARGEYTDENRYAQQRVFQLLNLSRKSF